MPRYARLHAPGALVHMIARFVNKEYRLVGEQEREALLERLPGALSRGDWTLHAYALMSNHVHLALLAGDAPRSWDLLGGRSMHVVILWFGHEQGGAATNDNMKTTSLRLCDRPARHGSIYICDQVGAVKTL